MLKKIPTVTDQFGLVVVIVVGGRCSLVFPGGVGGGREVRLE